jgi:hypothetical protein
LWRGCRGVTIIPMLVVGFLFLSLKDCQIPTHDLPLVENCIPPSYELNALLGGQFTLIVCPRQGHAGEPSQSKICLQCLNFESANERFHLATPLVVVQSTRRSIESNLSCNSWLSQTASSQRIANTVRSSEVRCGDSNCLAMASRCCCRAVNCTFSVEIS